MTSLSFPVTITADPWRNATGLAPALRRAARAVPLPPGRWRATLTLASDAEMAALNGRYRGRDKPTNVLSFPVPANLASPPGRPRPLGDIILGYETVAREATEQAKPLASHACHLTVHGLLHLLGHDHAADDEAQEMETLETAILTGLGYPDPYAEPGP